MCSKPTATRLCKPQSKDTRPAYKAGWPEPASTYLSSCALLICLILIGGCEPASTLPGRKAVRPSDHQTVRPTITFYHWQQTLQPDSLPLHLLEEPELFVKCFDVIWSGGRPEAVSQLEIEHDAPLPFRIVPVVFITNEVMRRTSEEGNKELAQNILSLLDDLLGDQNFDYQTGPAYPRGGRGNKVDGNPQTNSYRELQIDCDWTAGSRASYFNFLRALKAQLPNEVALSVTVRLHQFRDRKVQGIPPADRGSLMVYNVGDLSHWETKNSIIDSNRTANYLINAGQGDYPLPLDMALPLYQWGAVYRQGKLTYLIDELSVNDLSDGLLFRPLNQHGYFVNQNTYLNGYLLYEGDRIRLESSPYTTLMAVSRQLSIVPSFTGQRLLFYRIGSALTAEANTAQLRSLSNSTR